MASSRRPSRRPSRHRATPVQPGRRAPGDGGGNDAEHDADAETLSGSARLFAGRLAGGTSRPSRALRGRREIQPSCGRSTLRRHLRRLRYAHGPVQDLLGGASLLPGSPGAAFGTHVHPPCTDRAFLHDSHLFSPVSSPICANFTYELQAPACGRRGLAGGSLRSPSSPLDRARPTV